jgi:hypothetical protein
MEASIDYYNDFVEAVKTMTAFDTSKYIDNVEQRLNNFYHCLENNDLFTLFSSSKIKVFSAKTEETHKLSTSLFDTELSLKQIFNNQSDTIKNKLWELLFNMYIQLEKAHNNNKDRIDLLKNNLKQLRNNVSSKVKNDIFKNVLNSDVNNTTNNMLDDIINSFQDVVSNKGNPFENIMGITEMITTKYGNKIENGEVEIDKILGGMGNILGKGMSSQMSSQMGAQSTEEPVVIDENFSTSNVDIGQEANGPQINLSKLMPLADMVTRINNVNTDEDVMALKKDMDSFMEKELKVDMTQYKENMEKLEKKLEEMKSK